MSLLLSLSSLSSDRHRRVLLSAVATAIYLPVIVRVGSHLGYFRY